MTARIILLSNKPGDTLEKAVGGSDSGGMDTLEPRVAKLEADVTEIKAALGRMEPLLMRIDTRGQATAVDLAKLEGTVAGLSVLVNGLPKTGDLFKLMLWAIGLTGLASALPQIVPIIARLIVP